MSLEAERAPSIVDKPIITDPFEEPKEYWNFKENIPKREKGRRPAGYYLARKQSSKKQAIATEEFVELKEINKIRKRVNEWRSKGYPGVSRITLDLLKHWTLPDRNKKLFFCQVEAAETIIWLIEAPQSAKQGISIPKDIPTDPKSLEKKYEGLTRYACKMATGSGKTIVMAMIIAWSVLNKVFNKQDKRFSDAVLIVCPNLTVKERLQVLYPSRDDNYYKAFDLVPSSIFTYLHKGKFLITNWHLFSPVDDESKKGVVKKGKETDYAFCKRALKDLGNKGNILVLNDEAHHAYRPANPEEIQTKLTKEDEKKEFEEATVWINGLDRVNAERKINFCIDMTATPYYLQISGYGEGTPLPWIISDFGLVDAIESGIVKIPRVPVDTNSGRPIPEYFELWKWIMEKKLRWSESKTSRRAPKPESVVKHADGALGMLASVWKETFEEWKENNYYPCPPVMIAVCANTDISKLLAERLSSGRILPEFKNENGNEVTLRIDSKKLEEADSRLDETVEDQAAALRRKVSTVGKPGKPGENVRCVVSVSMLSEGWDAQNVTQILGLRAFGSQLLCEQVVGRGLRRINYDDFSVPEYVDVYGIPFEVIPIAKAATEKREVTQLTTKVVALSERRDLEIQFPRVDGYIFDVKEKVNADIKSIPKLKITPTKDPTEIIVKEQMGYRVGKPGMAGPGTPVYQNRDEFYKSHRLQSTIFEIASDLTNRIKKKQGKFCFLRF